MNIYYFGTSLNEAGHYFWKIHNDGMESLSLYFPKGQGMSLDQHSKWPFDPERLPKSQRKGDAEFHSINGYSIWAICGSCVDSRPGCKSVFFTDEQITSGELKEQILSLAPAKKIIEKMPFEVRWP